MCFAKFQSLSGFFRPCNLATDDDKSSIFIEFQSLSGFFRPCNSCARRVELSKIWSFNPCRVFSGLATAYARIRPWPASQVSIPVGFFQALQRDGPIFVCVENAEFQSLSGFFRPCNFVERSRKTMENDVSIPVGFFQALQRHSPRALHPRRLVSIPVGFFQALQLGRDPAASP